MNKIHKLSSANLDSPGNACRCRIQSDYGTKAKLRDFVQAFQIKIHLPQFLQQKKCQISTLSSGRWFLSSESCIRFDDEVVFALKLHPINWGTPTVAITSKVLQYIMACRKYPKFYIPNIFKRFGICPATTTKTQATPGLRGLHHFLNSSSSLESRRPGHGLPPKLHQHGQRGRMKSIEFQSDSKTCT